MVTLNGCAHIFCLGAAIWFLRCIFIDSPGLKSRNWAAHADYLCQQIRSAILASLIMSDMQKAYTLH